MSETSWVVAAFTSVLLALVFCAAYALLAVYRRAPRPSGSLSEAEKAEKQGGSSTSVEPADADDFITARGSVGLWMLSYSFYAGSMGCWVVTAPAAYASTAGLLGLVSYALAAGAPIVVVAYAGGLARSADPEASSLPDYLKRRFSLQYADGVPILEGSSVPQDAGKQWRGSIVAAVTSCITIFVMSIAMLAEYASMGSLFRSYVGASGGAAVVPTLFLAVLTMAYTAAGGLYVSILTDRIQALGSLLLVVLLAGFLTDFRHSEGSLPSLSDEQWGATYIGYSSLLSMPLSLLSATLFSEAVWQRVWASEDNTALRNASWIGATSVSLVVFFFGFVGFLALWSGRADLKTTNPNLFFFAFFSTDPSASLDSIPGLLALICAAVMAEGGVDSLQNGITATISSTLLKGKALWMTRLVVVLVNIPLAIIGASPLVHNVLSLFLFSNMITVSCTVPLILALWPAPWARQWITEAAVLVGCACGMMSASFYGIHIAGSTSEGLWMTWFGNNYAYDYFVAALLGSIFGVGATCFCRQVLLRWAVAGTTLQRCLS